MLISSRTRIFLVTSVTMMAFAANSLLCREALDSGNIDAASFTFVRITSGSLVLATLTIYKNRHIRLAGSWSSAAALFGYMTAFSLAYNSLSAGIGALLLFGAVQITMIVFGLWSGERVNSQQLLGTILAGGGLIWFLSPSVQSPPVIGAILMLVAGISWGVYSLLGRGANQPMSETAGNFTRTIPFAVILLLIMKRSEYVSSVGLLYAITSGALASGIGYALWYSVLPVLTTTTAAIVQLSVPVLATFGGVVLLNEPITMRSILASILVLGGISIFILRNDSAKAKQ